MTQSELIARYETAHGDLVAALDACDADAIMRCASAIEALSAQIAALGSIRSSNSDRGHLDQIRRINRAAAQRLRFMRDDMRNRIALLQGQSAPATYGVPAGFSPNRA